MRSILIPALILSAPLHAGTENRTVGHASVQTVTMVTVGGQVRRPGPVPHRKNLTLYAAIQAAGGANEFGSMRRVKVIRDGQVMVFDLTKDAPKSVRIEAEDIIEVPQKNIIGR